jgi:hypothetical protein
MQSRVRECTSRRRPDGEAGFSLVEVVISSVLLILMTYVVTTLTISGSAAQKYAERVNRITEIAQDISDEIRADMTSSVRVFHNDTIGNAYLAKLDLTGGMPGIAYRLPTLDSTGIFQKESGTPRSGNAILFARQAWTATYTLTSGAVHQVDVYRIEHFYPAVAGTGPQPGSPTGLNLVKWVSEPLIDGDEIDGIPVAADRAELLQKMLNGDPDDDGVAHPLAEVVWLRGENPTVAGTLRHVQPNGTMTNNPTAPRSSPWMLQRDPTWSANDILDFRHHSLATNFAPATYRVGTFSIMTSAGSGFPHGFEVQLIGPSAARQLLLRLVLVSTNRNGHPAHTSIQSILDARDI